jgi:hypothetical protein
MPESSYTAQGAFILKSLIPYIFAVSGFGYAVWASASGAASVQQTVNFQGQEISQLIAATSTLSNTYSTVQPTVTFQGQEISQLIADNKEAQTLSYSISSQLAQLNQAVADIKANLPHAHQ